MTQREISFLKLNQVMKRTALSRSAIYLKLDQNDFPRPVKLGQRAIAWPSDAIDAWIDDRIAEASCKQEA